MSGFRGVVEVIGGHPGDCGGQCRLYLLRREVILSAREALDLLDGG